MFGLGFAEVILIAVLALIFIGPKQLPDVARVIARLINEWKRATSEFTRQFHDMRTDLHYQVENKTIHPPAATPPPSSAPPPAIPPTTPVVDADDKKDQA
jgi:sec-independent protein translocase protein TatB